MFVASSNVSADFLGAATNRMNSRDLLQRYLSPRQVMSFKPLVDQFATDVKTATGDGARFVFHRSITIGCRVGNHLNPRSDLNSSHRTISYAVFCLKKKKLMDVLNDDRYLMYDLGIHLETNA